MINRDDAKGVTGRIVSFATTAIAHRYSLEEKPSSSVSIGKRANLAVTKRDGDQVQMPDLRAAIGF